MSNEAVAAGIEAYRSELEDENAHPDDALRIGMMVAVRTGLLRAAAHFSEDQAEVDGIADGDWNNLGVARELERLAEALSAGTWPDVRAASSSASR